MCPKHRHVHINGHTWGLVRQLDCCVAPHEKVCEREKAACMHKARNERSSERTCMYPLSLSPCHPRVGMLRQTGSLFLGQWQCFNGRRCIAKEGSEIPADRGQSLSLSCSFSVSLALSSALSGYSLDCCELLFFCCLKSYVLKDFAQFLHDIYISICTDWVTVLSAELQNSWESATGVSHFLSLLLHLSFMYRLVKRSVQLVLFIWISLQCNFSKKRSPVRTMTLKKKLI